MLSYKANDDLLPTPATRAATRRAASTSTARRSSRRSCPFGGVRRRTGARRQVSSSTRKSSTRSSSARNISARGLDVQRRAVPPAVQELPAQHLRRHGVHRPEHQRLHRRPWRHRRGSVEILGGAELRAAGRMQQPTGACDKDDVGYGVRSQGVELEASYRPMRDLRLNAGMTYASTKYRNDLVGTDDGAPLNPALRSSRRALCRTPRSSSRPARSPARPRSASSGLSRPVLRRCPLHQRLQHRLRPVPAEGAGSLHRGQRARRHSRPRRALGRRAVGAEPVQQGLQQVAFNSPFQEGATSAAAVRRSGSIPGGRQIFSAFLAEPRTYGLTLRGRFSAPRAAPASLCRRRRRRRRRAPATQTCADGSVIAVDAACPLSAAAAAAAAGARTRLIAAPWSTKGPRHPAGPFFHDAATALDGGDQRGAQVGNGGAVELPPVGAGRRRRRRPRARHRWRYAPNGAGGPPRGSRAPAARAVPARSRALTSTTVVRVDAWSAMSTDGATENACSRSRRAAAAGGGGGLPRVAARLDTASTSRCAMPPVGIGRARARR